MVLCQHAVSRHGYADDIELHNHFKLKENGSLWEAIQSLEAYASDVETWMTTCINNLMLNDAMSELLVVVSCQSSIRQSAKLPGQRSRCAIPI